MEATKDTKTARKSIVALENGHTAFPAFPPDVILGPVQPVGLIQLIGATRSGQAA
jgi:hypothetical protein